MDNKIKIMGIKFDSSSRDAILRQIQINLKSKKKFFIVTPNPEQIMLSIKEKSFANILNDADISLPDGVGVVAAHRYLFLPAKGMFPRLQILIQGLFVGFAVLFNRKWLEKDVKVVRGREFFWDLIKLANKKGLRIYLLGGEGDEAAGTEKRIRASYKNLEVVSNPGPTISMSGNPETDLDKIKEIDVVKEISKFKPHLLFVAFGAPKQERWVYKFFPELPVSGVMVVGGTFKYASGASKLPPKLISYMGLEWLWRLFTGSQKVGRIANAFPKFPLTIYRYKLSKLN